MSRFAQRFGFLSLNSAKVDKIQQITSPSPLPNSTNWASQDDKIIIFLGVTGSGKSSFIKALTDHNDVEVGHGLCSETATVRAFHTTIESVNFMLVDTPGFNDTFRGDEEILKEITNWLATIYEQGKKITGVVYLHPINQPRMEGSSLLNLTVMQKLCGSETFENVVLASTFWDVVEEESGVRRENELCQTPQFWGGMKRNGSRVIRVQDYAQSKNVLLQLAGKREVALQIQVEMVEDKKKLSDTAAGQKLNQELARLQEEHQKQKRAMKERAQAELKLREEQNQRKLAAEIARQKAAHQLQKELVEEKQRTEQRIQQEKLEEKKRLARQAQREAEKERQRLKEIQIRKEKLAREQRVMEAAQKEKAEKERKKREMIAKNVLAARHRAEMKTQREVFFEACSRWTVRAYTFTFENQAPDFLSWCDRCFQLIRFGGYRRNFSPSYPPLVSLRENLVTDENGRMLYLRLANL
ncbi:hypothetical protein ACEPPN_007451 [Leptodophora sp. 'Broadleaf-Isolate-01']